MDLADLSEDAGPPPETPVVAPPDRRASVEVTDLVMSYGNRPVLTVDHLVLPAGRVTALVGPNGSGKSTLLLAVAGLRRPVGGKVLVNGAPPTATRPSIAIVLQDTAISPHFPATVADVVSMGRYPVRGPLRRFDRSDRRAVAAALERLGVADLARRGIQHLSGGQRQRVLVAQALAQEADVLLLDEPVNGLDAPSAERIAEVISAEAAAGCTVVVSTHDLAGAARADHVVLVSGRVVASGPPATVLTDENLLSAYGHRLLRLPGAGLVVDDGSHHHGPGHDHHDHDHDHDLGHGWLGGVGEAGTAPPAPPQ